MSRTTSSSSSSSSSSRQQQQQRGRIVVTGGGLLGGGGGSNNNNNNNNINNNARGGRGGFGSGSSSSSWSSFNDSVHHYTCNYLYVSRRNDQTKKIDINNIVDVDNFVGFTSPWAILWYTIHLMVPLCYAYIGLVIIRESAVQFPKHVYEPIQQYIPWVGKLIDRYLLNNRTTSSWFIVDIWCIVEATFYVIFQLRIMYLQNFDPLEACLRSAPLMELEQRAILWKRMMNDTDDIVAVVTGWFFMDNQNQNNNQKNQGNDGVVHGDGSSSSSSTSSSTSSGIQQISKYDIRDWCTWSMFEGRHQEHLTTTELEQLEAFINAMEIRVSLHLYGGQTTTTTQEEQATTRTASTNGAESNTLSDPLLTIDDDDDDDDTTTTSIGGSCDWRRHLRLPKPKQRFRFRENAYHEEQRNFFSNLYESYRKSYEERMKQLRTNVASIPLPNVDCFGSSSSGAGPKRSNSVVQDLKDMVAKKAEVVQDLRHRMTTTAVQQCTAVEETAIATANHMYETLIPTGSTMDKQLAAMSHATYIQFQDAWDSVNNKMMKERIETARFLSKQRENIQQQLAGYHVMLNRMRDMSSAVPSKQMAMLMRRITACYDSIDILENKAQNAFVRATGFAKERWLVMKKQIAATSIEPKRYAKFSSDPLLGIATYPLGFMLLMLGCTELPLRFMMLQQRGFQRRIIGHVSYYYHPGKPQKQKKNISRRCSSKNGNADDYDDEQHNNNVDKFDDNNNNVQEEDDEDVSQLPIVFVHGIGVGLIVYIPLIDALLESGRPILLPEIPYVSGFRPFQSVYSVLPPAVVASTMTAMLATHGYLRATYIGHSYGTAWLSYMCKYAKDSVVSLCFIDPICFCLHIPTLTKQFVYMKPDPGTLAYVVRTDVIVNWTIQRSFPWSQIILFVEEINNHHTTSRNDDVDMKMDMRNNVDQHDDHHDDDDIHDVNDHHDEEDEDDDDDDTRKIPCHIFLSDKDALVPAVKVEEYFKRKRIPVRDFQPKAKEPSSSTTKNRSTSSAENDSKKNNNIHSDMLLMQCTVFRGDGHGGWTEHPADTVPVIADVVEGLCKQATKISKRQATAMSSSFPQQQHQQRHGRPRRNHRQQRL